MIANYTNLNTPPTGAFLAWIRTGLAVAAFDSFSSS